jgi:hypothetical protein
MTAPHLRIVHEGESERVYGSKRFLSLTRKPDLPSPRRFEPTTKGEGDVVI